MKHYVVRFFTGFILLLFILCFLTCKHSPSEDLPEMCFDRDIMPIFLSNCAINQCHDGTGESENVFTGYYEIMHKIKSGDPEGSEIYEAITGAGEDMMPPEQPLSVENRTKIRIWIDQGALSVPCNGLGVSAEKQDK